MGVSQYLKEKNPNVQIVGLQPAEGASIAGIRRWPKEYLPKIFQVDAHCSCTLLGPSLRPVGVSRGGSSCFWRCSG